MGDAIIIIGIVAFLGFLLLMRMLGAWMFRINDVIDELREIKTELKKQKAAPTKAELYDQANPKV